VATVIMEPGKALVEPYEALVTRVLEVRPRPNGSRDVIVDAGLNDVPLIHFYPHRIIALDGTQAIGLPRGEDRIFGRLCMENDILARDVALPPALRTGTRLAICDVGGYDASMSYQFGMGEQR
jgi:diaminopimelate decarboxylase